MKNRPPRKWSLAEIELVETMTETHSLAQIGDHFGVSYSTIEMVCWRNGIDRPGMGGWLDERQANVAACNDLLKALIEHHGVSA